MARSPAVAWTAEAYEWREKGCLQWDTVPVFARRAVTAFGRGVSARNSRELDKIREGAKK